MYCITCNEEVSAEEVDFLGLHFVGHWTIEQDIVDSICFGPFASCPPPREPNLPLVEPDEEFMELIKAEGEYYDYN